MTHALEKEVDDLKRENAELKKRLGYLTHLVESMRLELIAQGCLGIPGEKKEIEK